MKQETLCLLLKDKEILLAMKKRKFGKGRWNGTGGKVESGESIIEAAIRETKEEINVTIEPDELEQVAQINFVFAEKPEENRTVHIFIARSWSGEIKESEEMKPQWFPFDAIPYDRMWPDDAHWLPLVLAGKKIVGSCTFSDNGNTISDIHFEETQF